MQTTIHKYVLLDALRKRAKARLDAIEVLQERYAAEVEKLLGAAGETAVAIGVQEVAVLSSASLKIREPYGSNEVKDALAAHNRLDCFNIGYPRTLAQLQAGKLPGLAADLLFVETGTKVSVRKAKQSTKAASVLWPGVEEPYDELTAALEIELQ